MKTQEQHLNKSLKVQSKSHAQRDEEEGPLVKQRWARDCFLVLRVQTLAESADKGKYGLIDLLSAFFPN